MLGRSIGITDDQLRHLVDEDPPEGLYDDRDAVLIRYARTLAGREHIDDALYRDLAVHFSDEEIIEICYLVGVQTLVTFFNKTFLADIDDRFLRANDEADRAAGGRPIAYPVL
jgi:alkylhydroperoxidase family enzyme